MLQKMRVLLLVCITTVLVACGDGGSQVVDLSKATPNFAGKYLITGANLMFNNCSLVVQVKIADGTETVTQNERIVTINSGGTLFTGVVDTDNGGFTVSDTFISQDTVVDRTLSFRTVTANSKYAFNYTLSDGSCTLIYAGTATRV
jgi:ABC-type Fe3+-hydroxamate transport system substrate-binding protein